MRSAGIWAGVSFTIAIQAPGFFLWVLPAGSFIVHHQAAVGFQHCPFRALLKMKSPAIVGRALILKNELF